MASTQTASAEAGVLEREYAALTGGCGVLDRSERGKLALTGPGAVEFLNGQVTNELTTLGPGTGCYAAFLTHKGKMLGDLRILALGARDGAGSWDAAGDEESAVSELLLDTERVALQPLFDMIRRFKVGYDVELHKRTLERGLLSVIGPDAATVAGVEEPHGRLAAAEVEEPHGRLAAAEVGEPQGRLAAAEHAHVTVAIDGVDALAVRTDVGIDLICASTDTDALSAALQARGATPVSETAAECVRIEHGRPRYGIDLDDTVIPQEAGLNERAVSFTKGCYVGQETVARLHYKGKPNRHLRGLRLAAPAQHGEELRLQERVVGALGSSALSPTLGPIALALVRREAAPGARLSVGEQGNSAELLELPF
jgi:folate-binding protein YgfZ